MPADQSRRSANSSQTTGKEPALSTSRPAPSSLPLTGSEPVLSGDEGLLHALEMTLHDNPQIRYNAVNTLEKFQGINIVERLLTMLSDSDRNLRNRAAWALIRSGDAAIPGLIEIVRSSKNNYAREEAAWALTSAETSGFVSDLIALLEENACEGLEGYIVKAICQAGTNDALAYLLRCLRQEQQHYVQQQYIQPEYIPDLSDILTAFERAKYVTASPTLLEILPIAHPSSQRRVIQALVKLNYQPACSELFRIATTADYVDEEIRAEALNGLHRLLGDPFIAQLMQMFDNAHPQIKCAVMTVLAKINPPRAAELIRGQLHSESTLIQHQAIDLAGKLRDRQSVPLLLALLERDSGLWTRDQVIRALGAIKDERAVAPLGQMLNSLDMVWLGLADEERRGEPWVLARDVLVPALRSIGTTQAKHIINEWESKYPEPPTVYWEWYI